MKTKQALTNTFLFLSMFLCLTAEGLPAKLTLQALNEDGGVAAGEEVEIGFIETMFPKIKRTYYQGTANTEGVFMAETSRALMDIAGCSSGVKEGKRKEGYYYTSCRVTFLENHEKKRWEPWNPAIKLPVRKKINPVPMFAKNVNSGQDSLDKYTEKIGFDFILGDFTAPVGGGVNTDVYFVPHVEDNRKSIILEFPNPNDGIVLLDPEKVENCLPSKKNLQFDYNFEFKGLRLAPIGLYENKLKIQLSPSKRRKKAFVIETEENFYIFKIRTTKTENGESAFYGKIRGVLFLSMLIEKLEYISFTYLLNPDGTRNLEFDPKQNLNKDPETSRGLNEP